MSFSAKLNWKIILNIIGFLLMIEGVFMLFGALFTFSNCKENCYSLIYSGIITLVSGLVSGLLFGKQRKILASGTVISLSLYPGS